MEPQYIALARDEQRKDSIVFSVVAQNPKEVRHMVEDFYLVHDWAPMPSRIDVRLVKHTEEKPVVFIGHALEEYQELEDQVSKLAAKLLDAADGDDSVAWRDEIYKFIAQFELGRQVIDAHSPGASENYQE